MESKAPENHLLALKVMKLTRPVIGNPIIVTSESKDLPGDIFNNELKKDITSVPGIETISAGQFLVTPQSIGNIYLGEWFVCYIFVHNESLQTAKDVSVISYLQIGPKRIDLAGNQNRVPEVQPDHTIDKIIRYEVQEIGTHLLACEVHYEIPGDGEFSFRKFFKFEAVQPLDIKTKTYNAGSDEVFLEAEVQNITAGPIHLEKVDLESSHLFKVSSLDSPEEKKLGGGMLMPQASRQYLYCMTPVSDSCQGDSCDTNDIGILNIIWRSNFGERGILRTTKLPRMPTDYGDIRLSVHKLPNIVKMEEPFTLTCKISNLSNREMDLVLNLEKIYSSLIWIGTSGRSIGNIPVGGHNFLNLTMVPLSAGLHSISGIRLKDKTNGKNYDFDEVAQVFVT